MPTGKFIRTVQDCNLSDAVEKPHDLLIFASGFETRCTHIPKLLSHLNSTRSVVIGFAEKRNNSQRWINDDYFRQHWGVEPLIVSADDETPMYPALELIMKDLPKSPRILVDYSSMSRLWYAGVLNFFRYNPKFEGVEIDFLYSLGRYQDDYPPLIVNDVLALPVCEGSPAPSDPSIAVLGLGFDNLSAISVVEQLQAERIYTFYADPGAFDDYAHRTHEQNWELISHAEINLRLPLRQVEKVYMSLLELLIDSIEGSNIYLIPMGPKPHVLASILLASRYPHITCLRASGRRAQIDDVLASGETIATTVRL